MKVWILSIEIADAPMADARVFATEAEAYAAFREEIVGLWNNHFPGDTMPEDTDEAWEMIRDTDWNNDHVWITETEFQIPLLDDIATEMRMILHNAGGCEEFIVFETIAGRVLAKLDGKA